MHKKKIEDSVSKEVNKEHLLNIYQKYLRLYPAKAIAKSLDINWKNMSHEESNRIMLALLEDAYKEMATVTDKDKLVLETKLLILK